MNELQEGAYARVLPDAMHVRGSWWLDAPHPLAGLLVRIDMVWEARDPALSVAYVSSGARGPYSVPLHDLELVE